MSLILLPLLFSNPAAPSVVIDEVAETQTGKKAPPTEGPTEPTTKPTKFRSGNEWLIHIAPGATLLRGAFTANGPSFRVGGWASRWLGNFYVAGGPVLHYGYLIDKAADDQLHLFTLQGDLALGGGIYEKFAVYAHMTGGLGVLSANDGATDTKITTLGARFGAGLGFYAYVIPRLSIGALADFGYYGTLGIDALLTVNVHFGQGTKK